MEYYIGAPCAGRRLARHMLPGLPSSPRNTQACALQQLFNFLQSRPVEVARNGLLESAEGVAITHRGFIRIPGEESVNKARAEGIPAADTVHNLQVIFHVVIELPVRVSDGRPG